MENPTLGALFIESCGRFSDKTAVVFEERAWSYRDMQEQSGRIGALIRSVNLLSTQVGLLGQNHISTLFGFFGVLLANKTLVPMNPLQSPDEIALLIDHSEQELLLHTAKTTPLAEEAARRSKRNPVLVNLDSAPDDFNLVSNGTFSSVPDDLAMILYTSGTTGDPKGVMLTHDNFISNTNMYSGKFGFVPEDHFYVILPVFHVFAVTTELFSGLFSGATLVLHETFNPKLLLPQFAQYNRGIFIGVPPMYMFLARCAPPGYGQQHQLRLCVSGGGPMPAAVQESFENAFGMDIHEGYGLTEAAPVLTSNVPDDNKKGTIGGTFIGIELKVCDDLGSDVGIDADGELWARGANVMVGYFKNQDATSAAITQDGWLKTGDLARIDAEGYVTIVGRKKDLIVCAGENIYPREIEETLIQYPGVLEAAVVGVPDRVKTEVPKAFVTPEDEDTGINLDGLREWCMTRIGSYKLPVYWQVVKQLPKTATGKVKKNVLQEMDQSG
jgi:long-chain acyl-CoA synthetase